MLAMQTNLQKAPTSQAPLLKTLFIFFNFGMRVYEYEQVVREQLGKSVVSFRHVGPGGLTQVELASQYLYLLSIS